MHNYEIMLANGKRIYYETDMSFDDFKLMISNVDFIEIETHGDHCSFKATYQTKSFIYVHWDEEREKEEIEWKNELSKTKGIKDEIFSYIPNFRIKWKFKYCYDSIWDEDTLYGYLYKKEFLEKILRYCKKYKCKKK